MSENVQAKGELEMLDAELERLTERYRNLRKAEGVDKKWLNKAIARLEEALIFAGVVYRVLPGNSDIAITKGELDGYVEDFNKAANCTCPMAGVLDTACPVHGGNR